MREKIEHEGWYDVCPLFIAGFMPPDFDRVGYREHIYALQGLQNEHEELIISQNVFGIYVLNSESFTYKDVWEMFGYGVTEEQNPDLFNFWAKSWIETEKKYGTVPLPDNANTDYWGLLREEYSNYYFTGAGYRSMATPLSAVLYINLFFLFGKRNKHFETIFSTLYDTDWKSEMRELTKKHCVFMPFGHGKFETRDELNFIGELLDFSAISDKEEYLDETEEDIKSEEETNSSIPVLRKSDFSDLQ
jgi:hypothetical protein